MTRFRVMFWVACGSSLAMSPRIAALGGSCRILALVLGPRDGALAVVDPLGLVTPMRRTATSAHGLDLRSRARRLPVDRAIDSLIARTLAQYRPTQVVLGISSRESIGTASLRLLALENLAHRGVAACVRSIEEARTFLLGSVRGGEPDALPRRLVNSYFPELAPLLKRPAHARRFHRHVWNAAALAVATFARLSPEDAAFLLRLDAPDRGELLDRLRALAR